MACEIQCQVFTQVACVAYISSVVLTSPTYSLGTSSRDFPVQVVLLPIKLEEVSM